MNECFVGQCGDKYTGKINGTINDNKILYGGLATLIYKRTQ